MRKAFKEQSVLKMLENAQTQVPTALLENIALRPLVGLNAHARTVLCTVRIAPKLGNHAPAQTVPPRTNVKTITDKMEGFAVSHPPLCVSLTLAKMEENV